MALFLAFLAIFRTICYISCDTFWIDMIDLILLFLVWPKIEFKVEFSSKKNEKKERYIALHYYFSYFYFFYSVFLLLSQPTKPAPMHPIIIAPGAGIGA